MNAVTPTNPQQMIYPPMPYASPGYYPGCNCGCPPQCNYPPPPPPAPAPIRGPILGVTDGSDAKPGEVGEYMLNTATINYAAYPTQTNAVISALVLTPGDWNMSAFIAFSTLVGNVSVTQSPIPTGMSIGMQIGFWQTAGLAGGAGETTYLSTNSARGNFTVPTLISFQVFINQMNSGMPAGTAYLYTQARRVR